MSFNESLAQSLQGSLQSGDFFIAAAIAFVGGLLSAASPCVYPLISITMRYFGAMQGASRAHVLSRAATYVGGMIALYVGLGVVAASLGSAFGSYLGNPWVTGAIALFTFAMGLSLLGLFTIQLPAGLNARLSQVGGRSIPATLAMGLVSGLIAAPCTGPVLAVVLTVIASAGAVSFGSALMASFGLGLGTPFLVLAVSTGALARLPKGGAWMELVKIALATMMFVVAAYFLDLAWPAMGHALGRVPAGSSVALAAVAAGVVLGLAYLRRVQAAGAVVLKTLAILLLTGGVALAVLAAEPEPAPGTAVGSDGIAWITAHDPGLARARAEGRPVMIDFTADWCAACKELDKHTYTDARVRSEAARFVSLKLDATTIDDAMQALFDKYAVVGLPTVLFIDSSGAVLPRPRVTGFIPPDRFVTLMAEVR